MGLLRCARNDRQDRPTEYLARSPAIGHRPLAIAVFFMGSPSFLGHQRALAEGHGRSNCQTLFGMTAIQRMPTSDRCWTAPRRRRSIRCSSSGRDRRRACPVSAPEWPVLIALDGTECFCSRKIHCPRCQPVSVPMAARSISTRPGRQIVAPGHRQVLPLPAEFIAPRTPRKTDCERNAAKRWLDRHGPAMHQLRPSSSATICSPVSPSPPPSSSKAAISSSHAYRRRIRPLPSTSPAPNWRNIANPPSQRQAHHNDLPMALRGADARHRRRADRHLVLHRNLNG